MRLPPFGLAVALASFNLGVEAGQIALALLLVPIAFLLRHESAYRRVVTPAVSLASLTFVERHAGATWTPYALGVVTVPVGISAGYGYGAVHECRRYRGRFSDQP